MPVFMCIYSQYRTNISETGRSNSLQLIFLSVDRLKHKITAWIIRKFKQLVNLVSFNIFLLGYRVRLNLY